MQTLLKKLTKHYKIYCALQIGLDTEVTRLLENQFMFTQFADLNTEWSHKTKLEDDLHNQTELFVNENAFKDWFDYNQNQYDLVIVQKIPNMILEKYILDYLIIKQTRHILTSGKVFHSIKSHGYIKYKIPTEQGIFKLYTLDYMQSEIPCQ